MRSNRPIVFGGHHRKPQKDHSTIGNSSPSSVVWPVRLGRFAGHEPAATHVVVSNWVVFVESAVGVLCVCVSLSVCRERDVAPSRGQPACLGAIVSGRRPARKTRNRATATSRWWGPRTVIAHAAHLASASVFIGTLCRKRRPVSVSLISDGPQFESSRGRGGRRADV
jgi:hypothetical protein